jgi:transcriptional regulator with XRE-family HTH domain
VVSQAMLDFLIPKHRNACFSYIAVKRTLTIGSKEVPKNMKLKELRTSKNLSQAAIGKICGVSGQTILNWESGINEPSIKNLIVLADYFEVSVDYLIGREDHTSLANELATELSMLPKDNFVASIRSGIQAMLDSVSSKK